jgi:hypothetical protein
VGGVEEPSCDLCATELAKAREKDRDEGEGMHTAGRWRRWVLRCRSAGAQPCARRGFWQVL